MCSLLKESNGALPLRPLRIEAGSLWLVLVGQIGVVKLMSTLLASAASYIHRNFTKEGKLGTIPKKVEIIDSVLNLETHLQAAGIDTSQMRENIQKSSIKIANDMNQLLSGEDHMELNGVSYPLTPEGNRKLLEKRMLMLDEG